MKSFWDKVQPVLKEYRLLLISILISMISFRSWLSFDILSKTDWRYFFSETIAEYSPLSAWMTRLGLGAPDTVLWRGPYTYILGLLGQMGFDSNIPDKFMVLWPIIILTPIAGYLITKRFTHTHVSAFVGSLVFSFNTYYLAIATQGHILLNLSFAVATIGFWVYTYALEKQNLKLFLTTTLLMIITGFLDLRSLYIIIAVIVCYTLFNLISERKNYDKKRLIDLAKKLLASTVILILTNVYWILTFYRSDSSSTNEIFSRSLFGNEFWNFPSALTLFHPFWNGTKPEWFVVQVIPIYFWLIPILAIIGFYLNRKFKWPSFFLLMGLVGVILSKQADAPFEDLYQWLFNNFPGFRAFREATKFYYLILLSYSILIGYLIFWLQENFIGTKWKLITKNTVIGVTSLLFLANLVPFLRGDIQTMFVPRNAPQDYRVWNDFVQQETDFHRTLWVPRDSKWATYTNNNPKISAVEVVGRNFKSIAGYNTDKEFDFGNPEEIMSLFNQSFSADLINSISVKYVVLPIRDITSDDDFFRLYGGSRAFFQRVLDQLPYLEKIDIGTKELIVYRNRGFRNYIFPADRIFYTESVANLNEKYRFLQTSQNLRNFDLSLDKQESTIDVSNPFEEIKVGELRDNQINLSRNGEDQKAFTLYKNLNKKKLYYELNENRLDVYLTQEDSLRVNDNLKNFADQERILISSQTLDLSRQYFIVVNSSPYLIQNGQNNVVSVDQNDEIILFAKNNQSIISNGDFQSGLWQQRVGNCNKYDDSGIIGMGLEDDQRDPNNKVLRLEAQRQIACTNNNFPIKANTSYLLNFDYQSPNAKFGEYRLTYNSLAPAEIDPIGEDVNENIDNQNTNQEEVSERISFKKRVEIRDFNQWYNIEKFITTPAGTSEAGIALYANDTDGNTNMINLYDNVALYEMVKISDLDFPSPDLGTRSIVLEDADTYNFSYSDPTINFNNKVTNGDFENGLWQQRVGNCNRYDNRPILDMKIVNDDRDLNNQVLQLEAARHIACTGILVNVRENSNLQISFDYQSPNSKNASLFIAFDDDKKTVFKKTIPITDTSWNQFNQIIEVPDGATSMVFRVDALSLDDERVRIINRYDNVQIIEIPDLIDKYYTVANPDINFAAPQSVSFTNISPTQKEITINSANSPFWLNMGEAYHDKWQIYFNKNENNIKNSQWPFNLPTPLDSSHFQALNSTNYWFIDPARICSNDSNACTRNEDGSVSFTLIADYDPQRWLYLGYWISVPTFIVLCLYLIWAAWDSFKKTKVKKDNVNESENKTS